MKIGIVGLGLIGGSMAKSIKAHTAHTVWGVDTDHETMALARMCGVIAGPLAEETLPLCDLLLIAVRPDAAVEWLAANASSISRSAVVTDLCGVKRNVVSRMAPIARQYGFSYIGGHPMAGRERGGFASSSEQLFDGASMILTPDSRTNLELLETLKAFFMEIGFGSLTFSTPEEHDRIIAYTSQLAHIASSAYIKSPEAQRRCGFSAGSFRDMTRVAQLDENMWTELFLENADFLTTELETLVKNLSDYLEALQNHNAEQLRTLLKDGREKKATAGGT